MSPCTPGPTVHRCWALLCAALLLLPACSRIVDFPADCRSGDCRSGFTCSEDGVQCRTSCSAAAHCRAGYRCEDSLCVAEDLPDGAAPEPDAGPDAAIVEDLGPGTDSDGDEVLDAVDVCPAVADPDQRDRDIDGRGDLCDSCPDDYDPDGLDGDGDEIGDACDVCPGVVDPDQVDTDGDGRGDLCDTCPGVGNRDQTDGDGDGVGDACDVCPLVRDPDQLDRDADGLGDACDPCPRFDDRDLTAQDCPQIPEDEALPGGAPNGAVGAAQEITLPCVVEGVVGLTDSDPYSGVADVDHYLLQGAAGTILRMELVPLVDSELQPVLDLLDGAGVPVPEARAGSHVPQAVLREVLLPADGPYLIRVSHEAGIPQDDAELPYELLVQTRVLDPGALSLPASQAQTTPDGALFALRLRPELPGYLRVTFASDAAGDVGRTWVQLASPRRLLGSGSGEVVAYVPLEEQVVVIHDPGPPTGAAERSGTWTASLVGQPDEPGEGASTPLPLPGAVQGLLGVAAEGQSAWDSWTVAAQAGEPLRFVATGVGGNLEPALRLVSAEGEVLTLSLGGPAERATLEAVAPADGLYQIQIGDRAALVGNAEQDEAPRAYQLAAELFALDELRPERPESVIERLPGYGRLRALRVPARQARRVLVGASALGGPLAPTVTVLGPGDEGVLTSGPGQPFFFPPAHLGYLVLVSDRLQQLGDTGWFGAQVVMTTTDLRQRDEEAPNEIPDDAPLLGLAPLELRGELDSAAGDSVDYYRFNALRGGLVQLRAQPGPDTPLPSRLIVRLLAGERVLASKEGTDVSLGPVAPLYGEQEGLLLEVRPRQLDRVSYVLQVDGSTCEAAALARRPESGELELTELHLEPTADRNGDGVISATGDAFVELVNTSGDLLDLGGLVVLGGTGADQRRALLPCGVLLRPHQALVLFGGGSPLGPFGGATVATVAGPGLLPAPGTAVALRDPGELESLLTVDPGAGTAGHSRVPDPANEGQYVDHDQLDEAEGRVASPGTRCSGETFTVDRSCVDDRDCCGVEACVSFEQQGQVQSACTERAGWGLPGEPCAVNTDCASGRCGEAGGLETVCLARCRPGEPEGTVCASGAICYEIGERWFVDGEQWLPLPTCAQDRGSEAPCARDSDCSQGEVCVVLANGPRTAWSPACRLPMGELEAGALCVEDADCASGFCLAPASGQARCVGACVDSEQDCVEGSLCQGGDLVIDDRQTPAADDDVSAVVLYCQ